MEADKMLLSLDELDAEVALELPERRLLQVCNSNSGICVGVQVTNVHVCANVAVLNHSPLTCNA